MSIEWLAQVGTGAVGSVLGSGVVSLAAALREVAREGAGTARGYREQYLENWVALTAQDATKSGFDGLGSQLRALVGEEERTREIAHDLEQQCAGDRERLTKLEDIVRGLVAVAQRVETAGDFAVVDWLDCQWHAHRPARLHSPLMKLFRRGEEPARDGVYVELHVESRPDADEDGRPDAAEALSRPGRRRSEPVTLADLLESETSNDGHAPRWIVYGDAGSGKTTLARRLTWARSSGLPHPDAVLQVPVYLDIPRLARSSCEVLDFAERELASHYSACRAAGLAGRLRTLAEQPGRVWLLLDGLDETDANGRAWFHDKLASWSRELQHVPIVVLSRRSGGEPPEGFGVAHVRELDEEQARKLLTAWLGDAERARELLENLSPSVHAWGLTPLLVSLLALLRLENRPVSTHRFGVLHETVDVLLRSAHKPGGAVPGAPPVPVACARKLLARASLRLQRRGEGPWAEEVVLEEVHAAALTLGAVDRDEYAGAWQYPTRFLAWLRQPVGVLVEEGDGRVSHWSYVHRWFREFLAAEALAAEGPDEVVAFARELSGEDGGRWGEVLAFAAGLVPLPRQYFEHLAQIDLGVFLRALPSADALPIEDTLDLLLQQPDASKDRRGWHGGTLVALLRERGVPAGDVERRLAPLVTPDRSVGQLAHLHHAWTTLVGHVDREKFFRAAGRWPAVGRRALDLAWIEPGRFFLGSPEDEEGRFDDEGPRREVEVTASFWMMAVPVTNALYEAFDPGHRAARDDFEESVPVDAQDDHPVYNVTWYEAAVFAAWVGEDARLPREAEWEYACRAGTTTRFWSGDDDAHLAAVGWYEANSDGHTHPVREKPANAWGLHDLHGNVWEWCADAWDPAAYARAEASAPIDPTAPPPAGDPGADRVIRGGGWGGGAQRARSAYRGGWHPRGAWSGRGFRLVLPAAPSSGLDRRS